MCNKIDLKRMEELDDEDAQLDLGGDLLLIVEGEQVERTLALVRRLRSDPRTRDQPLLAITDDSDEAFVEAVFEAGT